MELGLRSQYLTENIKVDERLKWVVLGCVLPQIILQSQHKCFATKVNSFLLDGHNFLPRPLSNSALVPMMSLTMAIQHNAHDSAAFWSSTFLAILSSTFSEQTVAAVTSPATMRIQEERFL